MQSNVSNIIQINKMQGQQVSTSSEIQEKRLNHAKKEQITAFFPHNVVLKQPPLQYSSYTVSLCSRHKTVSKETIHIFHFFVFLYNCSWRLLHHLCIFSYRLFCCGIIYNLCSLVTKQQVKTQLAVIGCFLCPSYGQFLSKWVVLDEKSCNVDILLNN